MLDGPGTNREPYIFLNEKWGVRLVHVRVGPSLREEWLVWYLDGPFDGVDDGSLDAIFPWDRHLRTGRPLFLFGDYSGVPTCWKDQVVFKQSCSKSTPFFPFFYSVVLDIEPRPITECAFDVGFYGSSRTHPCRQDLRRALRNVSRAYFFDNARCWWGYSQSTQQLLRRGYLSLLEDTQFVLCPRGKGLNSIRFFEALRLGRIPVLVSDDTKLPLEDRIDYSQVMVRVPEAEAGEAYDYIIRWLEDHDLPEASARARLLSKEYFEDLEKFVRLSLQNQVPVL